MLKVARPTARERPLSGQVVAHQDFRFNHHPNSSTNLTVLPLRYSQLPHFSFVKLFCIPLERLTKNECSKIILHR